MNFKMFYGSSLKLSVMQYITCTNKPFFASNEMEDMLKGMVHSFKFHVKNGPSFICAIVFVKLF